MVNGISNSTASTRMYTTARVATQAAGRYSNDVENMIKFVNGQPLTSQDSAPISDVITGNIPFLGAIGGYSAYKVLKNNKFNIGRTINTINAASTIKSRSQYMQAATEGVADKFKDILKKSVPVNDAKRWKIFKLLDKVPGYSKLRHSGFGQMMGKTGAGSWAVFGGAIELLTQVVPAFKEGGISAGFKQLGKSAVKVAADTAGFIAGDIILRGAGAAIGTLICPGVGTAIGSYIGGFLGGMVGSAVAGKLVKSVVGPSEIEKIQQSQTSQIAEQINADPNAKLQLAQQALQQAEATLAQDPQNEDALEAKASAENTIAELSQAAPQIQNTQDSVQFQQQTNTGFTQPTMTGIPVIPGFNSFGVDLNTYKQGMQNASSIAYPTTNNLFNQNIFNNANLSPFMVKQTVA